MREIRQDILNDYNAFLDGLQDNIGIIELMKKSFENKIDSLIKTIYEEKEERKN